MNQTDIILDDTLDVACVNGDLKIGDSSRQHQSVLLKALPASFKQNPSVGIGIEMYLLDESQTTLFKEIRRQFTADGMTVNKISQNSDGNIIIEAKY